MYRMKKRGIACCVGVGPGDPELMTLKALRRIRDCDIVAAPSEASVAMGVASAAMPEIVEKRFAPLPLPMAKDRAIVHEAHRRAAALLEGYLDEGLNVAYLTLGDPTIYCTFTGIQRCLEADGYEVELVSGVPSFCAAAARLKTPLAEWDEPLHVIPVSHQPDMALKQGGNCVLMKAAGQAKAVAQRLRDSGRRVSAVENCGMADERVFVDADAIPDDAGYFTTIIVKGDSGQGQP